MCLGRAAKNEDDLTPFGLLAGLGLAGGSMPGPATNASTAPTVKLPSESQLPPDLVVVVESIIEVPRRIDGGFVPVGKVYEVGPDLAGQELPGQLYLPSGMAELTYEYDPEELTANGFLEEFAGFYFDKQQGAWLPVDKIEVNVVTHTVKVYTSHFTPFVLTAVPAASGGIADPPACISDDYPAGISGSAGADFTIVDTDFKYYKDRLYTIDRAGGSFDTLGFNGALAITVCNGNSPCGTFAQHKQYTGTDYIHFTAHTNIDLYLMYDTRGGVTLADDSKDAPWIQAAGFVNTGHFVETSDAVGRYRVYKKSYNKGDLVILHGNRNGVTAPGIDTNYWTVIKRQGVTASEPAAKTCETNPSLTPPLFVSNVRIAPGSDRMSLAFELPDHADFAGVVIRRSTSAGPSRIGDGIEPTGAVVAPTAYRDETLSPNTDYYYTVFALDKNGAYGPGVSVSARTGPDGDGDGLSNAFESAFTYPSGDKTDPLLLDTDADSVSDGIEFINGTDPRLPDTQKPQVTQFQLTSPATTNRPRVTFQLDGSDNEAITGWLVTQTDTPPVSWASGWTATRPTGFYLGSSGNHKLFAWALDAAGNVSAQFLEVAINLEGINAPKYLYNVTGNPGGSDRAIEIYSINPATGQIQLMSSHMLPDRPILWNGETAAVGALMIHPNGQFLYQVGQEGALRLFHIQTDGTLQTLATTVVSDAYAFPGTISPGGKVLLLPVATQGGEYLRSYLLDDNGALSPEVSSLFTNYTARSLTALPGGFAVGDIAVTNGGVTSFSVDELTGIIQHRYVLGDWTNYAVGDPLGRYVYSEHVRSGTIQTRTINADGSLTLAGQVSVGVLDGRPLAAHPNGDHLYVARRSTKSIDIYQSGTSYALVKNVNAGLTTDPAGSMLIDPTGTLAFVKTTVGTTLLIYRIDPGDLTLLSSNPGEWSWPAYTMVIATQHDGNDPPLANAGIERWVAIGESAALHGHNTFDPDAVRCSADVTKYAASWAFVSKPAGSALADSDIINANTRGSARFIPDVPGDYVLRLTFTDDPGSCQGTAKSAAATVKIKAGYKHTQGAAFWDQLGTPPHGEAVWNETLRYPVSIGVDSLWSFVRGSSALLYGDCMILASLAYGNCNVVAGRLLPPFNVAMLASCAYGYGVSTIACAAQFQNQYQVINVCNSPLQPDWMAFQYCEERDWVRDFPNSPIMALQILARGHVWVHLTTKQYRGGHWSWYEYNPPAQAQSIAIPRISWP